MCSVSFAVLDMDIVRKIVADMELSQYHGQLHKIFDSLLNTVIEDIPENDQVRFVLQSPQLEKPISLPFLSAS
jgi:hypothetical protein